MVVEIPPALYHLPTGMESLIRRSLWEAVSSPHPPAPLRQDTWVPPYGDGEGENAAVPRMKNL